MDIDLNRQRQFMIQAFGLQHVDKRFTFFYDETNNIRKFYLTDDGTNVSEHKNFVIGGIALREGQQLPDIDDLRTKMRMQENAPEIKFSHVAKGDFEQVLASKKLGIALSWLIEHNVLIHYSSVNIISWSLSDIIDSVLMEDRFQHYGPYQRVLKNELYRVVSRDKRRFLALMKHYGYPDIQRDQTGSFLSDICALLDAHGSEDDDLPMLVLRDMMKEASTLSELAALTGNEKNVLIADFEIFYTRPVMLFQNSVHIFDHELQIEKGLAGTRFKKDDGFVDFSFSDSRQQSGIQVADVVTGLIGKYQSFVEEHSLPELLERKANWSAEQMANFQMLRELIDRAHAESNALIFRSTTEDSQWRNDTFMHDLPAAHRKL
ncbi:MULTISPECIES: DUF3800 domain-containing protein [unclassified Duganella]|uniref:DUF3800 domain-containing protein n=1 Tax=unclassified Duganella TaxID=2636909 RepID=UPI000882A74E|nr:MULTISPECIES: DUF3800 domain-containing protein [unclassified Duganella]SDG06653.1 Protein of unknown function [Duganella sp. OV458]SDI98509.1 Protein of unknown function [Duganella sp. OV510]